jgi:hypothetical protein
VNLSGLNLFPLAISLPRCSSPYHEAIPLVAAAFACSTPGPAKDKATQITSARERTCLEPARRWRLRLSNRLDPAQVLRKATFGPGRTASSTVKRCLIGHWFTLQMIAAFRCRGYGVFTPSPRGSVLGEIGIRLTASPRLLRHLPAVQRVAQVFENGDLLPDLSREACRQILYVIYRVEQHRILKPLHIECRDFASQRQRA